MIRLSLSLLLAVGMALPPASAADKKPADKQAAEKKPADKRPGRRVVQLDLAKAIRFALAKNFAIEAERYSPRIARERVRTAWGRFDPDLDISYLHGDSTVRSQLLRDPVTGELGRLGVGSNAQDDTLSIGVSGVTIWGLGYDVGASTRRFGASGQGFEQFTSELSLGLNQPLLRGAGTTVNLAGVRVARNNVAISEWGLKDRVIDVITQVTIVYNELNFTYENLGVATRSRSLAQRLLDDNQKRLDAGVMTPLDVTQARAEVAAREEAVLRAERNVQDQGNFLKQLITDDLLPLLGAEVDIVPPKAPPFYSAVLAGVKEALELRPDYRQAKLDIQNRNITVAVEKNSLLPRLDLNASLSLLGLDDDFGTSQSRSVTGRDRAGWSAGAIFSLPLGNREARGRYNAATLEAAQALVRLQQLEQSIIVAIDNANGAVVTARKRIDANVESSRLARETVDAGEKRLIAGTITSFDVLELQNNLAEAETAELRARADYHNAIARYQQQVGITLRVHGVSVE